MRAHSTRFLSPQFSRARAWSQCTLLRISTQRSSLPDTRMGPDYSPTWGCPSPGHPCGTFPGWVPKSEHPTEWSPALHLGISQSHLGARLRCGMIKHKAAQPLSPPPSPPGLSADPLRAHGPHSAPRVRVGATSWIRGQPLSCPETRPGQWPSAYSDTPSLLEESNKNTLRRAANPQPAFTIHRRLPLPLPRSSSIVSQPPGPYEKVPLQPEQVLPRLPTCPPLCQPRVTPALPAFPPIMSVHPGLGAHLLHGACPTAGNSPALACCPHPFQPPHSGSPAPISLGAPPMPWPLFLIPQPPAEVSVSWLCLHPWLSPSHIVLLGDITHSCGFQKSQICISG